MLRSVSRYVLILPLFMVVVLGCSEDDPLTVITGKAIITSNPGTLAAPWALALPDGLLATGEGSSTVSKLSDGNYILTWQDVEGWRTPTPNPISKYMTPGATLTFKGTYVELSSQTGDIDIDPDPNILNAAWTLTSGSGFLQEGNGDLILEAMPAGDYQIVWSEITDYQTPPVQALTLVGGEAIAFQADFLKKTADILINPTPVDADWHIEGPDGFSLDGTGDSTLRDKAAGDYTLTWMSFAGHMTPIPETRHLADHALTFTGVYIETGSIDGFIAIKASGFSMGSPTSEIGRGDDEMRHNVNLTHDFHMQTTEVTNRQYGDMLQWAFDRDMVFIPSNQAAIYDLPNLANGVAVSGNLAFVVDHVGLLVLDISDPSVPARISFINTPGSALSVAVSGNLALVADAGSGLQVIDISDPFNLVPVGSYDTPGRAVDVAVEGTVAYVADSASGLLLVDISDPNNPFLIGSQDTPGHAEAVVVVGPLAYVADNEGGLRIIDIAVPANPVTIGSDTTSVHAVGIAVSGGRAFIADSRMGLFVINIANPATPSFEINYDTPGSASDVKVRNAFVFVADGNQGLQVIDLSDTTSTTPGGAHITQYESVDITISGDYIYMADLEGGLRVVNISSPLSPYYTSSYNTLSNLSKVLVDLSSIYCDIEFNVDQFSTRNPEKPMVAVNWFGAVAYCDWLNQRTGKPQVYNHEDWSPIAGDIYLTPGYRLPTEAEWEFSCRAGTVTAFNTGFCLDSDIDANFDGSFQYGDSCTVGSASGTATTVGSYVANDWGLVDMHGNVMEWCYDGSQPYSGDSTDPVGVGGNKIVRGGSWGSDAEVCRSANRYAFIPEFSNRFIGFRVVR